MKSSLGWLLLVAVLAVPALLFWKWWGEMQFHSRMDRAGKPPVADAFKAPPGAPAAAKPQAAVPSAPAGPGAAAAAAPPPAAPVPAAPVSAGKPPASPAPSPADASAPTLAAATPSGDGMKPVADPAAAPRPGRVVIEFAPSVPRDPTLSQIDIAHLKEEEEARDRARQEIDKELHKVTPKPVSVSPANHDRELEKKIELQGVVATPNGMMALVSGESLREGDQIYGFVVTRITTRYVTFKAGSRTFTKPVE